MAGGQQMKNAWDKVEAAAARAPVDDRVADEAMARYAAGDDVAFGVVYDHVAPLVERYLCRRVRDRELVRDLLQQTFLKMHIHRSRFIPGAPVRPWACCIAVRLLMTFAAQKKFRGAWVVEGQEVDAATQDPDPEATYVGLEMAALVEKALGQLPRAHREAVEAGLKAGTTSEAAASLGTNENSFKIRKSRGLSALKKFLGLKDKEDESNE